MRKIVLFSLALIVSLGAIAANDNLSQSISKSLTDQSKTAQSNQNSSIYYGGKDISHPLVAENHAGAKVQHNATV